jgi:hypothetical protein
MIFAFDHEHRIGDVCSRATCEFAGPVLAGSEALDDMPMLIVREATPMEYLHQTIPDGWCIPALGDGCDRLYEIQTD